MSVCYKSQYFELILPQNIIRMDISTFIISFLNLCYPGIFSSLLFYAQEPYILSFLVIISYVYMALYDLPSNFL